MPLFPEIVRRLCGPLSRRGDGKWFALAAAFLVVNAWLAWNLVHTGGVQAPGAGSGAAGGVSVAPTPPLKLISATQASYDGANNTAVLKLTFNLPPSPQQFERAVTLVRVGSTGAPVHFEMCGGIRSPDVLIRTRDPVHGGEQLLVTVCKGLAAAGNAPPTDSEQRLPVPVSESFQIGEIDPQSPPFEPCRVQVSFGRRIDPADAAVAIAVQPAVKLDISEHYDGCTVAGDFQPGTSYAFTFRKGLKAADGTRLAEDAERTVIFPDRAAALSLAVDGNFLSPRGALNVPVLAMNVRTCETALRRVCRGNVVFYANRTDRYDRCNRSSRFGRDSVRSLTEPAVTNVVALPERPNREHKFYVNLRTLAGAQPTGVYSLSVSARDSLPRSYRDYDYGESDCAERLVVVTDLGLTARMGLDGVLVWVNALRTAQPAADVEVTLYARNNMELARARTDAQGLAFLPCRADLPEEQQPTLATAAQGDDLSYLRLSEERPFQDACGDAYLNGGCEAFVFSERGVYRPGETVHAETLVRDADLQPPAPFPVLLRVVKPDGRTFRDLPATLSARGAAEFSLELPAYLPTGIYGLHVVMPGTGRELGRTSVSLEEFVPPQIAVTLDQLPARLRTDERLPVDVGARHLFGSPAAGLPVSASVYLRDIPFKPAAWAGYTFGDAEKPALKRAFQLGERHLDVDGRCAFTNDALGPLAPAGALLATVCATVSDSGGRGVSAYASTLVDAYPFYIGIKPPGASTHARVGTALVLGVIAVSPDGRACQPGAPLLATVERVAWTGVMRRNNGHYVWQSERTKIKVGEPVRVALRDGAGTYAFTAADTGDYLVTLTDPASGASSSVELFASAADAAWVDWARDKPAAAQLSLDRPDYAPGQKAKLALKAPFGGTALLTIESDRVLERRVLTLAANTAEIEIDVKPAYAPNVYCAISIIRPAVAESVWSAHRAIGSALLKVVPAGHRLTVAVEAPPLVRPQGSLAATVRVTDEAGAPVAGAEIVAMAVDEGICNLTDFATPDPLAHFLRPRAASVTFDDIYSDLMPVCDDTSDATVSHIGGDGGFGARVGRRLNPIRTRRFKPVALWRAGAVTDAQGTAAISFDVPEFTGELRVTAVAFTASAFGGAKRAVTVKRPLVVQAELPRFLAPGDTCRLALAIFNETNAPLQASWRVTCGGPLAADRSEGALALAANSHGLAAIVLRAGPLPGKALCGVEVTAGGERYAESFELAVRPVLAAETRVVSGALKSGAEAAIAAPGSWLDGSAYYEVGVSRQPDLKLNGALGWLLRYPYGCCEQTASASFPLLYLSDLANRANPQSMGAHDAAPFIMSGVYRLLSMQGPDGGFAMWPDSRCEEAWISIYATHFLVEAKRSGYAVPEDRLNVALAFLAGRLDMRPENGAPEPAERAYICHVLALAGRPERGWAARLLENADTLPFDGRAHLAAALLIDGKPREARTLLAGLDIPEQADAPDPDRVPGLSVALAAWLDIDPTHDAVPRLVHALEGLRVPGCGWWGTTHDNAFALLALGRYAHLTKPERTPFSGELVPIGAAAAPFASDKDLNWNSGFPGAVRALRVRNRGPGTCWYTVRSEGVPAVGAMKPEDAGIAARREFLDVEGKALDPAKLRQGTLVVVKLTLDTRGTAFENLAIEDLLPAGWEVENPSLATARTLPWVEAKTDWCIHRELRDDRVLLFTGTVPDKVAYLYTARAVTPGVFSLPPVRAEAMYRPEIRSVHGGGKVEVVE